MKLTFLPKNRTRPALLARAMAAALALGAGAVHAADPVPIEAFFKHPAMRSPTLSPSGRWLAVLTSAAKTRVGIAIIDLEGGDAQRFIEVSTSADANWVQWVNEDWLVFTVQDPDQRSNQERGRGLMTVKRDGSESRMLIQRQREPEELNRRKTLPPNYTFRALGPPGSSDVIVEDNRWDVNYNYSHSIPMLLNVETGGVRSLIKDGPRGVDVLLDAQSRARVVIDSRDGETTMWWSDTGEAPWRQISKTPNLRTEFWPAYVENNDTLVVSTEAQGRGELRRFDVAGAKVVGEPILAVPGFSMSASPFRLRGSAKVLGVSVLTDAEGQIWFDPAMKALQDKVDAKLPGRVNFIDCRPCDKPKVVLVTSYADTQPAQFVLYRPAQDRWQLIGETRPDIDPRRMAPLEFHRTKARDGRDLPVWVTRPADAGNKRLPAVVMPHGGPWVRGGEWQWNADAQFLASRGYVVIEPEFRGGWGFGFDHFQAGWKQWGLTMQDDVSDALKFAVAQGWADPAKVCIVGFSYGGYASLMGVVKDPAQYRCAVAGAPVTDLRYLYDMHWSDESDEARKFGLPVLVGDRKADVDRFIATSPVEQAAKIQVPVMLVHGGKDRRVPIENGERMRDALLKAGKKVEWVTFPDEGHGFQRPENRIEYWRRIENFLAQNLK